MRHKGTLKACYFPITCQADLDSVTKNTSPAVSRIVLNVLLASK